MTVTTSEPTAINSLTESEWILVSQTRPEELRKLDLAALAVLRQRVRHARNKAAGSRRGTIRTESGRANGKASRAPLHTASKLAVFDESLGRIATATAAVQRATADEVTAQRLSASRGGEVLVDSVPAAYVTPKLPKMSCTERRPINYKKSPTAQTQAARKAKKAA